MANSPHEMRRFMALGQVVRTGRLKLTNNSLRQYHCIAAAGAGYEWVPLLLARLVGIEPYEVHQVFGDKNRWPRPAEANGIPVLTVWGRTWQGRYLIVVLRATEISHDWLIIGVREMTARQAAEYDQWEAWHGHE